MAAAPQPAEERKLATVLFADLAGSTELGAAQDPERTRALLDRFYDAMAAEIADAGGTVEKFAGDAVMAAFGVPSAQEDHAERALHAALAMQRRLEELFGDRLALRIGVNTGEVVAGRPREGSSFVTGDAVNVAARLEQAAAPGEILAGDRTVAAVRGAFELGEPATVEAKGKPGGVACRRVLRALSLTRPRGVSGLRRAFVGRGSELELLRAAYRRAAHEGGPHLVTVLGDAGVGKSTLLRELWAWLGDEPSDPLRRTGRCLAYGRGITYWPLGEVLKEHFGIRETDAPEAVRGRLGGREVLGLAVGLEVSPELHPLAARERLHEAWIAFLDELAADRPVVLVIEDLHWAEDPLLDALDRTLREARGPLLLLATGRPELLDRRPAWGGGRRNAATIWLEPLSQVEAGRLLDELVAGELPPRLRELVVGHAEGNPFFVEELLGSLIDQGILRREDGAWTARELPGGFAAPDSVQAVLAARIDLLGPLEKAALQAAAVIGRVFWDGPVRELLEGAEPDLAALEERDFVRRRPDTSVAGEREWAFKHAVTREVAYGSVPKARRARLHAACAAWLERGEGRDERAPFIAHHYAEAVRPDAADLAWGDRPEKLESLRRKAVDWLSRAAGLAVSRYEIDDALDLYRRALELGPPPAEQARLWRAVGLANALKFDGEAFWPAMQRSLELTEDAATRAEILSELAFETAARSGMWKRRPGYELVDAWVRGVLELAAPASPARARALIARAYWDPAASLEAAREAVDLADRLGDDGLRSYAWDARRLAAFREGEYAEACAWADRRFELLGRISDPDHLAGIYEGAIPAVIGVGRFDRARELAAVHEDVAWRLSAHHRLHCVAYRLQVEELAGEWEAVRALTRRAEEAVRENLATPCVLNCRSLLVCALAGAHLGDDAEARRLEDAADGLRMEGYGPTLDGPRMQIALARGELARVRELLAEPEASGGRNWYFLSAMATRLDALAALAERERVEAEARPHLRPGTYLEPFALRALGLARGERALVERAAEAFDAMGLGWHARRTRAAGRAAAP